jgi:hypothetical protein
VKTLWACMQADVACLINSLSGADSIAAYTDAWGLLPNPWGLLPCPARAGIRDAWKKDVDFAAISEPPAPRASTAWPLSRVAVLAACSGILGVTCVVALRRR